MQQEKEVKFLDVDHAAVRSQLKKLGATLEEPMRLMHRSILDYPDRRMQKEKGGWIRVRDEGAKTTLTYKQVSELSLEGVHEIEVTVGSYDKTIQFLEAIGMWKQSEQESRRETWRL